jgi:hypothetical protein
LLCLLAPAARASDPGTEFEKLIGPLVARSLQDTSGVDDDPLIARWVREMGARVSAASPRRDIPYHYRILRTDVENAYTLPGGTIFVTRGLLDGVDSDDELAAVLAHEAGHVAKRHALQQIGANVLTLGILAAIPGGKYNTLQTTAYYANILRTLHKSREMEAQADEYGVRFAAEGGYDPNGLVRFFAGLDGSEPSRLEQYFATHPTPRQRVADARRSELVARPTPELREEAARYYQARGLRGEAEIALRGGDPLALPPLPGLPVRLPAYLATDRRTVGREADAVRNALRPAFRARQVGSRLRTLLLINNQPSDPRWLYIAARTFGIQADIENVYARTLRVARTAPPTWDALARYDIDAAPGDPLALEGSLGRAETIRSLERVRGAATPLTRAARAVAFVAGDLNNRFWRPGGTVAWVRYLTLEATLRYAESELARADKMSGRAWRLLSMARVRRYQARLTELVPEGDAERRTLWADLTQRRFGAAFPTAGPTGDATVRAALAVELGESATALDARRGTATWADWALANKGIPENIATAMRLLTLDLERETAAADRKRTTSAGAGGAMGGGFGQPGGVAVERVPALADGNAQPGR